MSKKTIGLAIALLCYSTAIAGAFYLIGYKAAYGSMEHSDLALLPQTFYATISDIQDSAFTVTGIEMNDINFRGEFRFSIGEEAKVTWRLTDIPIEDLDVGDLISITFTGEVLETAPAQIQQVLAIQLLEDER